MAEIYRCRFLCGRDCTVASGTQPTGSMDRPDGTLSCNYPSDTNAPDGVPCDQKDMQAVGDVTPLRDGNTLM